MATDMTGGRMPKAYGYFFTVFIFIIIASLFAVLGFEPATTSIMFTFTLAIVSFIGIYVVGISVNGI
jgi:F-type H+-transporting ATPase subunit a